MRTDCSSVSSTPLLIGRALGRAGKEWKLDPGEGAFYGPKIDITVYDALKRKFQCATVQVRPALPSAAAVRRLPDLSHRPGAASPDLSHRAPVPSKRSCAALPCAFVHLCRGGTVPS